MTRMTTSGGVPILFDAERWEASLAPWAERPSRSLGRPLRESGDERTPHQRDRDRIIHASSFRRLRHKTQVFVAHEGDHYRTRLTHSLEVAQVARSIARALRLNEDLSEAIALAHDLGHPPFGHAGERALHRRMEAFGGFDHNVQSLRVVTDLERRYLGHDGLNLTWETLEGLAKHNGAVDEPHPVVVSCNLPGSVGPALQASLEAQVAALADDIAYNAHDIDDGLRAGLFTFADLRGIAPMASLLDGLSDDVPRSVFELMRRQITMMVRDVVSETARAIERHEPASPADVRASGEPFVRFSEGCRLYDRALRDFLWERVYGSSDVLRTMEAAERMLGALFDRYVVDPTLMGGDWRAAALAAPDDRRRHRVVTDYIAGMTDTYARERYAALPGDA